MVELLKKFFDLFHGCKALAVRIVNLGRSESIIFEPLCKKRHDFDSVPRGKGIAHIKIKKISLKQNLVFWNVDNDSFIGVWIRSYVDQFNSLLSVSDGSLFIERLDVQLARIEG